MPEPERIAEGSTVATPPGGYRFDGVVLDLHRARLEVDGREVACQPLVLRLLEVLCRARGAVVSRDELFAALWSDLSFASDESLTKAAHRLRASLAPYGERLVTVRKRGFRLDAAIQPLEIRFGATPAPPSERQRAAEPALEGAAPAAVEETEESAREAPAIATAKAARRRAAWRSLSFGVLGALGIAALAVLGTQLFRGWRASRPLDLGYGWRYGDLAGENSRVVDLARLGIEARNAGDRQRAIVLFKEAHGLSRSTPALAGLLATSYLATRDEAQTREWLKAARERARSGFSVPYVQLFAEYVESEMSDDREKMRASAAAALAERPDAWYLRLALAHFYLSRRELATALSELQKIEFEGKVPRAAALVLADRASLGDAAGAERILARIELPPGAREYLVGRIAWTRGDPVTAVTRLDEGTERALAANAPTLAMAMRELATLLAVEARRSDAERRIAECLATAHEQGETDTEFAMRAAQVWFAFRASDLEARDHGWQELRKLAADDRDRTALTLFAPLVGEMPPEAPETLAARLPPAPDLLGVPELLRAVSALAAGDREGALALIDAARDKGLERTSFAEQALPLELAAGRRIKRGCRPDPPYPNLLRFVACWEVESRSPAVPPGVGMF